MARRQGGRVGRSSSRYASPLVRRVRFRDGLKIERGAVLGHERRERAKRGRFRGDRAADAGLVGRDGRGGFASKLPCILDF